jgi:hypothetical protein
MSPISSWHSLLAEWDYNVDLQHGAADKCDENEIMRVVAVQLRKHVVRSRCERSELDVGSVGEKW